MSASTLKLTTCDACGRQACGPDEFVCPPCKARLYPSATPALHLHARTDGFVLVAKCGAEGRFPDGPRLGYVDTRRAFLALAPSEQCPGCLDALKHATRAP